MNEYKNKLIITILLLFSFVVLFLSFYKIDNDLVCSFSKLNENYIVISSEQLPVGEYLKCYAGGGCFHGKLALIEYDGKNFLYSIYFKESTNIHIVDSISIIKNKISIMEYLFNYLKNSF